MQKAQMSLDLMLTLTLAIILIGSFTITINNVRQNQDQLITKQQLVAITENTANLITSSQSLSDTSFIIQFRVKKISYLDGNNLAKSAYPEMVTLDNNTKINAKMVVAGGKVIDYNASFGKGTNTIIDLTQVKTNGLVVIRNA